MIGPVRIYGWQSDDGIKDSGTEGEKRQEWVNAMVGGENVGIEKEEKKAVSIDEWAQVDGSR